MTKTPLQYEIYNVSKTCDENYAHGPYFEGEFPTLKSTKDTFKLWDFELNSPLGIPSGPMLNSKFIEFYAKFGFDLLVYKTVRSVERPVHPWPNCVYVDQPTQFRREEGLSEILTTEKPGFVEDLTITNSFGVQTPSADIWMADVARGNSVLSKGQLMPVSITGTDGAGGRSLADDFAFVAAMAKEAGAKVIIANYSCPNVASGEGSVYADPEFSAEISEKIRKAIGNTPFMIKVGWLPSDEMRIMVAKNRPFVDGYAGINTVPKHVRNPDGTQALPGEGRLKSGLCGAAIREVAQDFVISIDKLRTDLGDDFVIWGVGGMMTPQHLRSRLNAGADFVLSATAPMWDPYLATRFRDQYL